MLRALPFVIELALLVFALIDCIQSEDSRVRHLPKVVWILLIVLVPVVGPIVWLAVGRPTGPGTGRAAWPATRTAGFPGYERRGRPVAPDDDPEFLAGLGSASAEHEAMLSAWEAQLREREERLGVGGTDGEAPGAPTDPPCGEDESGRPG